MASWQAHAVSLLLRHTFKKNLIRSMGDVEKLRKVMSVGRFKVPGDIEITPDTVGGVPGEWLERKGSAFEGNILYLHGGGYFACSPVTHRPATCWFARAGLKVFAPDYRLAPEHPFPAAIEDARAVTAALGEKLGSTDALVVAGDSAGGGLALATMLAERNAGGVLPKAGILFSPWTDMAVTGESVTANERSCAMFTADGIRSGAQMYINDADPKDPLASPIEAELGGLPPLLIHASQHECLRDDSTRLAERAKAQGVAAILKIWDTVPHTWQLFHKFIPEGRESLREASEFAKQQMNICRVAGNSCRPDSP